MVNLKDAHCCKLMMARARRATVVVQLPQIAEPLSVYIHKRASYDLYSSELIEEEHDEFIALIDLPALRPGCMSED